MKQKKYQHNDDNDVVTGRKCLSSSNTSAFFKPAAKSLPPELGGRSISTLIIDLESYVEIRESEWSFHYNFLGLLSIAYFLLDLVKGTDYFDSKSKETKINAAKKLGSWLESSDSSPLSLEPGEKQALQEGRLGELMSLYGGLEQIEKSKQLLSEEVNPGPIVKEPR